MSSTAVVASVAPRVRGATKRRSLTLQRDPRPLARHPDDGWLLADPYPMSEMVRRALRAVILAICPPPPAPSSAELFDRVELYVRRFMRYMHPLAARGLWLSFLLLDFLPLLLLKGRRLQKLPREAAARLLTGLSHSTIGFLRLLCVGVRGAILSGYFDQDEVHKVLGYAPVPFISERTALRKTRLLAAANAAPAEAP
jgi:hypothetical protein